MRASLIAHAQRDGRRVRRGHHVDLDVAVPLAGARCRYPPASPLAWLGRATSDHPRGRAHPHGSQAWAEARADGRMAATGDVLSLPGLSAALISMVILVLVGVASLRGLRRRISYERWHFLHLLTYLAVALGFAHQLAGPDLAGRMSAANCLEPALHLRLRAGAPLEVPAASLPALAASAAGGRGKAGVTRCGEHADVRRPPGRAAGRARSIFSLEVPDPQHMALGVPVLTLRRTHLRPTADHRQGTRGGNAAHLGSPGRHAGVCRGAVRCADARGVAADRGC